MTRSLTVTGLLRGRIAIHRQAIEHHDRRGEHEHARVALDRMMAATTTLRVVEEARVTAVMLELEGKR